MISGTEPPGKERESVREQVANAIRERTGLDESMALQAADAALGFIKNKLPPALAPMLDGQQADLSDPGALISQLGGQGGQPGSPGGLFGGRS